MAKWLLIVVVFCMSLHEAYAGNKCIRNEKTRTAQYASKGQMTIKEITKNAFYLHVSDILPGQNRISLQNVERKFLKINTKNAREQRFEFDQGRSPYPSKKALPVVKSSFGFVLADGHHDVMAALKLNADTMPVYIIEDLSHLSIDDFWREAEKKNYVFLKTLAGVRKIPPRNFSQLEDDPNRYLASLLARKVEDVSKWSQSEGAETPVWIKLNAQRFVEFYLGDILRRNGIVFGKNMSNRLSESFIERCHHALLADPPPDSLGILIVPELFEWKRLERVAKNLSKSMKTVFEKEFERLVK